MIASLLRQRASLGRGAIKTMKLVQFQFNGSETFTLHGVEIRRGDGFLLLQEISSSIDLDGLLLIPNSKLSDRTTTFEAKAFVKKVLAHRKQHPVSVAALRAVSFTDAIRTFCERYPIVCFHIGRRREPYALVGTTIEIGPAAVRLRLLNTAARWSGERLVRIKDIERVEVASRYCKALEMVACSTKSTNRSTHLSDNDPVES